MEKYIIPNKKIKMFNKTVEYDFPKYTSQLINWANQNAQGTRPKAVGQMSELIQTFMKETDNLTIKGWAAWYNDKYPQAIDNATDKIYAQIQNLQKAIKLIDKNMVHEWVVDLIINKTFNGLCVQNSILAYLAEIRNHNYRLSTPEEESKGIDGFVGNKAYSIKPVTYKTMDRLQEKIQATMIYYEKVKTGLKIEIDE